MLVNKNIGYPGELPSHMTRLYCDSSCRYGGWDNLSRNEEERRHEWPTKTFGAQYSCSVFSLRTFLDAEKDQFVLVKAVSELMTCTVGRMVIF